MDPSLQLFVSVLTLILTPIFSALVVAYQLSRTQDYWQEQERFLRKKEEFQLKLLVLKSATLLLNQLNQTLTEHHIYKSSRDIALAIHKLKQVSHPELSTYYHREYESFRAKAGASYLELRKVSFQVTELGAESSIYFDNDIGLKINAIRDLAKTASDSGLSPQAIYESVARQLELADNVEVAVGVVGREYDLVTEPLKPGNQVREVLAELHSLVLHERGNLLHD